MNSSLVLCINSKTLDTMVLFYSANLLELHCLADASGIGCDEVKTKVEILAIEEPETKGISGPCGMFPRFENIS